MLHELWCGCQCGASEVCIWGFVCASDNEGVVWFVTPSAIPTSKLGTTTINLHGDFSDTEYIAEFVYAPVRDSPHDLQLIRENVTFVNNGLSVATVPQMGITWETSVSVTVQK
eukprot:5631021-Pyramimonas_sp.AAC.2